MVVVVLTAVLLFEATLVEEAFVVEEVEEVVDRLAQGLAAAVELVEAHGLVAWLDNVVGRVIEFGVVVVVAAVVE